MIYPFLVLLLASLHLQMSNFEFGSFFSSTDLHVHWLFLGNWVISIYIHSVRLDVQFMLKVTDQEPATYND